jgi:Zn-dependent peptidase ImmA (M78 family)
VSRKLRRGFKTEAEYYAGLYRTELGLAPHDPLCPRTLADHLSIPVRDLSTHPGVADKDRTYWRSGSDSTFSALIVHAGTFKEIVHNDFHHPRRQNSNIAHELAHIILGHPLTAPIKPNGERAYDAEIEEEAKWLGAALLLPKKAAVHIILNGVPVDIVQSSYGVSEPLLQYRLRVTDAYRCAQNMRRKYG